MNEINFIVWFKTDNGYKQTTILIPQNTDKKFFYQLKMKIEIELEHIKQHITSLFENQQDVNLKNPKHEDDEKQKIIDMLCKIRKENNYSKELLKGFLADDDFIICDNCGCKMYKIPINVSYKKYGNTYVIKEIIHSNDIKYIYGCSKENCHHAILEDIFLQEQHLSNHREQLIKNGEKFVPNKHGFWNWIN